MAANPRSSLENDRCRLWLHDLVSVGTQVFLPEIADYELRRELIRADKRAGLARLDIFKSVLKFLPITSEAMQLAAQLWALSRNRGRPTAVAEALDGDAILAAQALTAGYSASDIVIATTNVGHLSQFVLASHWDDIR